MISASLSSLLPTLQFVIVHGVHRLYSQTYIPVMSWSFTSYVTLGNTFNSWVSISSSVKWVQQWSLCFRVYKPSVYKISWPTVSLQCLVVVLTFCKMYLVCVDFTFLVMCMDGSWVNTKDLSYENLWLRINHSLFHASFLFRLPLIKLWS